MARHPRSLLSSNGFLLTVAASAVAVGVLLSFSYQNFQWLSRFGAVVICAGVISLARFSLVNEPMRIDVIMADSGLSCLSEKHYQLVGEPLPDWFHAWKRNATAVGIIGPMLCLVGTVLNGFADLLTKIVWP